MRRWSSWMPTMATSSRPRRSVTARTPPASIRRRRAERERLRARAVARYHRHVARMDPPVVPHPLVSADRQVHVHGAVIGKGLRKVREAAFDVAEMDIEELANRRSTRLNPSHVW